MDSTIGYSGSPGLTNHIMESLFFSMSVYEPTQDAVLQDLQRRVGSVQRLIAYGFDEDGKQSIFVARSPSGRVVVACRGTVGFRDILQDLKYLQSRLSFVKGTAHWGFAERAESVPIDYFCKLLQDGEEVIFTGHSLGGAVASLLSLRVLESSKGMFDEQVRCITFGCPLFASCRLADLINSNYKDIFIHIVSRRDVVPKIFPFLSTLQKLLYADEDHLEGLFVLKNLLSFLPGLPLAPLITGLERKIPSVFKFLFRCFMKLAFPSGMTGSYAFAGHIVMLDTEATVDRSVMLASADEMNVWHSQLGFAFGSGFDVTMIEEHMLHCYHNGIVRAFSQVRVISGLADPCSTLEQDFPIGVVDKVVFRSDSMEVNSCRGLADEFLSDRKQQSFVIRVVPQETCKGAFTTASEIEVRCDSSNATSSLFVSERTVHEAQVHDQCHSNDQLALRGASEALARRTEVTGLRAPLSRARSVGEHNSFVRSMSWRLEGSRNIYRSNSAVWASISERREGIFVRSKRSVTCRTCAHLKLYMNVATCCHQTTRKGVGFGWLLGTIGRVVRHLRVLDNLCYLTFVRIVVGNLIG